MSSINRPAADVIKALSEIGCDTICSTLDALGIRRNSIVGPIARVPGSKICGPALTLQLSSARLRSEGCRSAWTSAWPSGQRETSRGAARYFF